MATAARLGFAIPAYRRPDHLDVALASLVPVARALEAPIYIPDDSCDATNAAVVEKWQRAYSKLIHEINPRNLGIDRNIDKAIAGCPAEYVHVMGEDDVILPGFAEEVMRAIQEASPGHIICSYLYLTNDYRILSASPVIPRLPAPVSLRSMLPEHGWTLGFIGAHVFHRERYVHCDRDGFGTYFNHIVRLVTYLSPDEPLGYVSGALVGNRADDESTATWAANRLDVVFGLERAFVSSMSGRYMDREVARTVASCRRRLGYTQSFRLLYWAALMDRTGDDPGFWRSLAKYVSRPRYLALRAIPRLAYGPLRALVPGVRRIKRFARLLRANSIQGQARGGATVGSSIVESASVRPSATVDR